MSVFFWRKFLVHRKAERENVLILNDVAKKEKEKPDLSRTDGFSTILHAACSKLSGSSILNLFKQQ